MAGEAGDTKGSGPKAKIFISYSRRDMAFVDRLEPALKERGFEPLIDRAEIYAFEDWWKRIESLVGRADTIVFVLSPDSIASEVCAKEVAHALALNKRFAPIVCRRADDNAIPEALRRLNFIFFDDPEKFDASLARLVEALQTDIGWIRRHTEYGEAARQWTAAGRPGGLLLRSPALEEAERWIASRPANAPAPTEETQAYIADSRSGATRRRNILTGSLAAGLLIAVALAGLAYWQRGVAVQERQIADQQRQRAEDTLAAATKTANSLVFDLATRFQHSVGIPITLIKDILDRAQGLQQQLAKSGQTTPDLLASEADALNQLSITLVSIGEAGNAYDAANSARQIMEPLLAKSPDNTRWQGTLSISYSRIGLALLKQDKFDDALAAYRKALDIDQALAGREPGNDTFQDDVAIAYQKIGDASQLLRKYDDTLRAYQASLDIWQKLSDKKPDDGYALFSLAVGQRKFAIGLEGVGRTADAIAHYQTAADVLEKLVAR